MGFFYEMKLGAAERWLIIVGIFIIVSMLGALMQEQKRTIKVTLGVKQSEYDTLKLNDNRNIDSLFHYKRLYKKRIGK